MLPLIAVITYVENEKRSFNFNDLPKFIILFFVAISIANIFSLPVQIYNISELLSIIFINVGIFFIALQSKIERINNPKTFIYPILLWIIIVLISFVAVTSI